MGIRDWLSLEVLNSKSPTLRINAIAAIINGGENAAAVLESLKKDRNGLEAFLAAVPLIRDDAAKSALYSSIRPLAFELPHELASTSPQQLAEPGVKFDYYEQNSFPNCALKTYDSWTPKRSGKLKVLTHNIPNRRPDKFGVKLTTWVNIPATGKWTFSIISDDGSRLYLDGKELINNDGNHGPAEKSASVELSEGPHKLVTTYFDSGGGDAYGVTWAGPGVKKQRIPAKALGGSDGGLERTAALALRDLPGHDDAIFADMVSLLKKGKHRDIALAYLAGAKSVPQKQLSALGKALAIGVPETPIAARDGDAFKKAVAFAKKIAGQLPADEAKALTTAVSNLDLALIRLKAIPEKMLYDRIEFTVKAGKPVKIIFENPDAQPHNIIICKPGSYEEIGALADKMINDPNGFAKQFIPESDKVLHTSKLINQGQTTTMSFNAPAEPGDYPYVCTFPGHWRLMKGVMHVE